MRLSEASRFIRAEVSFRTPILCQLDSSEAQMRGLVFSFFSSFLFFCNIYIAILESVSMQYVFCCRENILAERFTCINAIQDSSLLGFLS